MNQCLVKSVDFNRSPLDILKIFKDEPYVFLLDSSLNETVRGRFSFVGFSPFDVFQSNGVDSLKKLKEKFEKYTEVESHGFSPLESGIVGYLGYDLGLYQENIKKLHAQDIDVPDCLFGFYDCIITIDHFTKKLIITSTGLPEVSSVLREKRAQSRLNDIVSRLTERFDDNMKSSAIDTNLDVSDINLSLSSNFTKQQYTESVREALDYIRKGDIYQVNLSQRFCLKREEAMLDGIDVYCALRSLSPTHFGCFMDMKDFQVISSSPERFLLLQDGTVQTRPMKGTRPRGETSEEDQKLRVEITESPKEQAELLMVTDLERNDLGKVCDYGSVSVKEMRTIEEYKTVFQTTSTVEGKLREEKDAFDLLEACFPSGSITGCPKIRAMEIIEKLEPTRRNMYTGSSGYLSFSGNMDFNILIRTLLKYRDDIYFQVGGGIVADSNPEAEYNETLVKAKGIQDSLKYLIKSTQLVST